MQRGIETYEQAKNFFHPDLNDLHDPFLMKDMDKAVSRIQHALDNREGILVYGDYDVDGTTAVSMVYSIPRYARTFPTATTKGMASLSKASTMPGKTTAG